MLVNAGLVRESIATRDGLIGLHGDMRDFAEQLAGGENLLADNGGGVGIAVGAHSHCHHDFFESGIARALADAVDGALDLPRARANGGQRIGDGHAEIIMAVRRDNDVLNATNALPQGADNVPVFFRHGIADGVGNVDGGCAFIDHSLHYLAQKIQIRARGVFRGKFDVIAVYPRETN